MNKNKSSQFIFLSKTTRDIVKTIITNIIKMLTNRKKLVLDDLEENIKKVIDSKSVNNVYKIKTLAGVTNVKIVNQKITSVGKNTDIGNYLEKNKDKHIILIVKEISNKAKQIIVKNHNNIEVFIENNMMINIIDHVLVPKHEILSTKEVIEFYEAYDVNKKEMPKILINDPVAKYYGMKIGDICRIIRPSETNIYVNFYRLVVPGLMPN